MNLMKLFLIIFILKIVILSVESLKLKSYNETCDNKMDCDSILNCTKNLCKCPIGHIWSSEYQQCNIFLFGSCKYTYECQDQDPNTFCTSIHMCECKSGYEFESESRISGSLCVSNTNITIGTNCKSDLRCRNIKNSFCYYNKCACSLFYKKSDDETSCFLIKCTSNYQCINQDINSYCDFSSSSCYCSSGYYYSNSECIKQTVYPTSSNDNTGKSFYSLLYFLISLTVAIVPIAFCCKICCKICCKACTDGDQTETNHNVSGIGMIRIGTSGTGTSGTGTSRNYNVNQAETRFNGVYTVSSGVSSGFNSDSVNYSVNPSAPPQLFSYHSIDLPKYDEVINSSNSKETQSINDCPPKFEEAIKR